MADTTRPATWQYAVRVNDEFTVDVMPSACGHAWAEFEPTWRGCRSVTICIQRSLVTYQAPRKAVISAMSILLIFWSRV